MEEEGLVPGPPVSGGCSLEAGSPSHTAPLPSRPPVHQALLR